MGHLTKQQAQNVPLLPFQSLSRTVKCIAFAPHVFAEIYLSPPFVFWKDGGCKNQWPWYLPCLHHHEEIRFYGMLPYQMISWERGKNAHENRNTAKYKNRIFDTHILDPMQLCNSNRLYFWLFPFPLVLNLKVQFARIMYLVWETISTIEVTVS